MHHHPRPPSYWRVFLKPKGSWRSHLDVWHRHFMPRYHQIQSLPFAQRMMMRLGICMLMMELIVAVTIFLVGVSWSSELVWSALKLGLEPHQCRHHLALSIPSPPISYISSNILHVPMFHILTTSQTLFEPFNVNITLFIFNVSFSSPCITKV